jgi:hypothetical protein
MATPPIEEDATKRLPRWGRVMVSTANSRNRKRWPSAERFTEADLRALWKACGGRCQVTGLEFREIRIGSGAAQKAFAPSLDRIDARLPYTADNCRLVLQAVNFALNAYGDEVFRKIAEAANAKRQHT